MQQKPENFTQTIYRLAREQKEEALRKFLEEQGKDVGAVSGRDNAIYLLARDGEIRAVNFLIKKFNASRNWAIMGAAAGGYERLDLINRLLAEGAMINYAIYGAGVKNDEPLVKYLKDKGASNDWAVDHTIFLKCLSRLRGAAFLIDASIETLPRRVRGYTVDLCDMSLAAAQNGNEDFVDRLLEISQRVHVDPTALNPFRYATTGAFLGAQETLCERFSTKFGDQYRYNNYFGGLSENAAKGAGEGGHLNLINQILELTNPEHTNRALHFALVGAASGGQLDLISRLLSMGGKLNDGFFLSAAEAGNLTILNKYLDTYESENKEETYRLIIKYLGEKSHISGNPDEVLRVASFLDNSKLRKLFIQAAQKNNGKIDVDSLYRKASICHGLMREHQINYYQAQVWASPGIREWLLQSKFGQLPVEIIFRVAQHVIPLTEEEGIDLGMKINTYYQQRKEERLLKKESSSLKDQSKIAEEDESKENTPDNKKAAP